MEDEEIKDPAPALMRAVSFDSKIFDTINARKNKYMDAASFCMKVIGDKALAMKHISSAEQLKNLAADYKLSG